jgi:hypothetical protein
MAKVSDEVSDKVSDEEFAPSVAGRLSGLAGVRAVTLGGSRDRDAPRR